MTDSQALPFGVHRKQSLSASVIKSCTNCGAPGFWHDTPGVNPGCYAPERVTKLGSDFVGETCPNCGHDRTPVEDLGEIWLKLFGSRTALFLNKAKSNMRRIFQCL